MQGYSATVGRYFNAGAAAAGEQVNAGAAAAGEQVNAGAAAAGEQVVVETGLRQGAAQPAGRR